MKFLKTIGIILGALIALALIIGLLAPKEMTVSRSITIDAPPEFVYKYISTFEQNNRWQPWMQLYPEMESGVQGTDGEIGATYWWKGNSDVGKGEQTLKAMIPNERVEVELNFLEPWESKALAHTSLEANGEGTEVSWGFNSPMSFPMNLMGLFMSGALKKDYDKGLANLKALVETEQLNAPAPTTYEIKTTDFPTTHLVTYRKEISMDEMSTFMQTEMPKIGQAVMDKKLEMKGTAMNLTYKWDEENKVTDTSVAIPVAEDAVLEGYEKVSIEATKALVVDYYGNYEGTEAAHNAIWNHAEKNGIEIKMPIIEEYITDPAEEADPSKWLTRIYYLIEG